MNQTLAHAVEGYLPPFTNNEGQMAPGVKQIIFAQNRWKPTVDYDWATIKKEWTSLLHQSKKDLHRRFTTKPDARRINLKEF